MLAVATGCTPVDLLNATVSHDGYSLAADIPYGIGPRRRLDVYMPAPAVPNAPVIVFFYGGTWQSGKKGDYRFVAQALASRGIVTIVPDYRLWPEANFPGFVEDGAAAMAWTARNIALYGGNPGRIFLAGHSSGAHIAMLLGLDRHYLADVGFPAGDLAGIIGISGPYDFLPIQRPDVIRVFAGVIDMSVTQPITFADHGAPQTLLLAGDEDDTVEPRNSQALAAKLKAAGGTVTLKVYRDIGHIGSVTSFAAVFRGRAPVLDDVVTFVLSN